MPLHKRSRAVWTRDWVLFLFFLGVLMLLCIAIGYGLADLVAKLADYLAKDP